MRDESVLIPRRDYNRLWRFLTESRDGGGRHRPLLDRLERVLAAAKPLPDLMIPPDRVTLDSHVTLREKHTGILLRFQLVFPWDSDIEGRRLSVVSAIGMDILGRSVGQEVRCRNCERELELRIEAVDSE